MNFEDLGLIKPLLRAVNETGYSQPTPIQAATVNTVLAGKDLMASAQTGTGKTAAFTLPMLQTLSKSKKSKAPRALVITPTRELAAQVQASVETYGKFLSLRSIAVFGGVKINPQIAKLRRGIDILVATPGRLLDLYGQGAVSLDEIEFLILDEADRMLDMGFIHDIRKIHELLPKKKQSLMFSATFSNDIRTLARTMLKSPEEVDVAVKNSTAETVSHKLHPVDKSRKAALLSHLCHEQGWYQALVFTRTKHGANKLVKQLAKANIKAVAIHGNKSQAHRTRALEDFKNNKVSLLIATDIASRGLDIEQLPIVINHDLPNVPEDYVHRIGRTGRAKAEGVAVSLVSADEIKQLKDIERLIGQAIPREEIEGFEPDHAVPASPGIHKPSKGRSNGQKNRSNGQSQRRRRRGGRKGDPRRDNSSDSRSNSSRKPAAKRAA